MKIASLALALVAAASVFAVAGQLLMTSPVEISAIWPEPGRMNAADETDAAEAPQDFDLGKVAFSATLTRPLFSRSRRKFVAPQKPKPAALTPAPKAQAAAPRPKTVVPPPSNLSLIGVSLRNDQSSALVSQGPGENVWVSAGDKIAAWKVTKIDANSVRLTQGSQEVLLRLYEERDEQDAGNGN